LNTFTTAIEEATWDSTPDIKRKLKGLNFPREIKDLTTEKRKFRRKFHQSRHPHDKTLLNIASQQLSKEIKNIKQTSSIEYSLWKATKYLKRPIAQVLPIKKPDGKWARSNLEKANIFSQHLEKRFNPNSGSQSLRLSGQNSTSYF
jgi:hypothetical protein